MILVIDMNYKKNSLGFYEFVLPICSIAKKIDECVCRHFTEVTNADFGDCNSIILSGTPLEDNATLSQPEKFLWLRKADKPVLGICAGIQTIGVVFGLLLTRCLEIGMTNIRTLTKNPLFNGEFKAYSLHNFSVESSDEFEVLADSAKCVQAFKHREKSIYGVLFHPEARNPEIIERFINLGR